jgi:hypothetical protein
LNVTQYLEKARAWFEAIKSTAEAQSSPHRKAILLNFLEHAALEYTSDRWPEIFDPNRTVASPLYHIRMGSPDVTVYDGREQVMGFYSGLKEGTLTNEHINLAVDDWGFASFFKIHQFMPGAVLRRQGVAIDKPEALYHIEMPLCAMYWTYDAQARLLGEYVYNVLPATYTEIDPAEAPTYQQVQDIVQAYLPEKRIAA